MKHLIACAALFTFVAGCGDDPFSLPPTMGLIEAAKPVEPAPRFRVVVNYRQSGLIPHWDAEARPHLKPRWTPQQLVDQLKAYPDFYVDMGTYAGHPPGCTDLTDMGRVVNEAQALAKEQGVDASRLMFHLRSDTIFKMLEGWNKCSPNCGWGGTMEQPQFDPGWIMKVPRSEHQWALDTMWGGDTTKDPHVNHDLWSSWLDRAAMQAVNTPTHVAALYGSVKNDALRVSAVVMDLRQKSYRAWSVKRMIASLASMGIDHPPLI